MYYGDNYQVISNCKVGLDRTDICIIFTNKEYNTNITFEYKVALSEDCDVMKSCANKGLNQIDKNKCQANTPSHVKTIVEIAIAFYKKHAFVSAHVLQLVFRKKSDPIRIREFDPSQISSDHKFLIQRSDPNQKKTDSNGCGSDQIIPHINLDLIRSDSDQLIDLSNQSFFYDFF